MTDQLDLNLLRVFEALLEEESVTRTAHRLNLSQAAVSAALGRLRKSYGDILFFRAGHGMAPTVRALELAPDIRRAMDAIRATLGGSISERRHVILGMSDDIEMAFGSRLIASFSNDLPMVVPVFRQSHSEIAAELLRERTIDFALGSGGLMARGLHRILLGTSVYLSIARKDGEHGVIDLDQFCDRPHLLISAGGMSGIVDTALAALGRSRSVVASSTHFSAVPFLLEGDMIATIPAHAARAIARVADLHVFEPPVELGSYPLELSARSTDLRDPLKAQSMDVIRRAFTPAE
ncbi:LysR family transcriptional regulator [Erythrobacter mangrovi]|uniref:LysR family transcriptional regulator n=1 Tax=Erythrobacter mangrovi TaxID=2739433 RepID=A0A7D3XA85_9SPHN|nr:LysR family transcriptional regulator [Erythrobacter mangrovi]QKG70630.1 LysR family transcriptional regulator [Erythrobacter mangrovi]